MILPGIMAVINNTAQEVVMQNDKFVEWDDRYSVGIPLVDDQHKHLIELTNELYACCIAGTDEVQACFRDAIRGAVDYVKYHFAAEEKILENVQYPGIAAHKKEHEIFVMKILSGVKEYEEGKKFVPNAFVRFLRDWILAHIAVEDRKYADYIQELKKQNALPRQSAVQL
jgi:hemerythrin